MAQIDVHDLSGKVVGQVELPDAIFDGEVKLHLIHQMVKAQLAARRAGTHSTLTRSEVHGTNAKPWRQKGTGRARAGDVKSPVWRHGGTVFGPKPRSYEQKVNRKVRRTALKSAFFTAYFVSRLYEYEQLPEPTGDMTHADRPDPRVASPDDRATPGDAA